MGPLLNLIWDICCLRRGPQDLPYAPALLAAVAAAALALQWVSAQLLGVQGNSIGAGLLSLLLNFGVLYLLLTLRNLRNRFVQTATALLGCALLFMLISVPIVLLTGAGQISPEQLTLAQRLLVLLSLPLLVWKILVDANILRHSLNVPFLAGIAIALAWVIAEFALAGVAASSGATA